MKKSEMSKIAKTLPMPMFYELMDYTDSLAFKVTGNHSITHQG
jgi:hypothetical protein